MSDFHIESTRGDLIESVHGVSVAVVDGSGRSIAESGHPDMVTFWRSAAKPFQAMPLVADGAADHFSLGDEELALACASHSSERIHLQVAEQFLARIGCREGDLACGPHPPLGSAVAAMVARSGLTLTPRWSNCSGKHAGMLAQARHAGWSIAGYERAGHPVQDRIADVVAEWTGVPRARMGFAVDGCTTVCFALPLSGMARAYARFGSSDDGAARRLRTAMTAHPLLVAGTGRLCTELMAAWPGGVIAKIGAEGVYSAALPGLGIGLTLKVESGDMRAATVALMGVLRQVLDRAEPGAAERHLLAVAAFAEQPIRNTRGERTGAIRSAGSLRFR
jgi:L-asparaginase II